MNVSSPPSPHPDMREKCGIFGVYNSVHAGRDIFLGLYAQQHRGQEGAGIMVSAGPGRNAIHKNHGLVSQIFTDEALDELPGHFGIGHVRYSTSGSLSKKDIQPLAVTHQDRVTAIAHNGNITNAGQIKREMEKNGSLFTTSSDTEVLLHRIVRVHKESPIEKIKTGLRGVEGAYSLVIKFDEGVAAVRDPMGFRPLHLGKRDEGWYFASESCAFDVIGAEYVCEIPPGEGYYASGQGLQHFTLDEPMPPRFCAFELVYFSRPDSRHKGRSIHMYRQEMGRALWREHPAEADLVTAVPDSSNSAALGYSAASGIPLDIGLIRSHYTGRTFIAPHQSIRDSKVRQKFNVVHDAVKGKRIVVVDDSIVRGTTCRKIIQLFREHGAREIHFRIASPSVTHPCFFGIDMPEREEFLVNKVPPDVLNTFLGVDSLGFISPEALEAVTGTDTCRACFTGDYPVEVDTQGAVIARRKEQMNGPFAYI